MSELKWKAPRTRWLVPVMLVPLALGMTACGSSGGATAGESAASAQTSPGGGVAEAQRKLQALYQGVTFKEPPSSSPKPKSGKNVWVIDISLGTDSVRFANGATAAGKALGWNVTVFDGKFQPSRYLEGIQRAIAAKADGILLYAIDCPVVKAALQQAHAAGIPIAEAESEDCNGSPLFDGQVDFTLGQYPQWVRSAGQANADWLIVHSNGKAKVINFVETDVPSLLTFNQGFVDELGTCSGCKIVDTVKFTGVDLGPSLQQKAALALLQNADANAVEVPYDGVDLAGVSAAVMASGRNDHLLVVAGGGTAAGNELIRAHRGEDAGYGTSLEWEGWAGMDVLNRLFNGEKPQSSGIGMQVIDRHHNLPPSGAYRPPIDFAAAYTRAWAR